MQSFTRHEEGVLRNVHRNICQNNKFKHPKINQETGEGITTTLKQNKFKSKTFEAHGQQ